MASSIAALTAGGGGVATTADSSGNLNLLSGTTTVLALTATGIAVTGTLSASGVTTNAAGSAALPSITTTGDTDTGVWFPAANTLAASTSGTERMRIDSSGNVLFGTTGVPDGTAIYGSGFAPNTNNRSILRLASSSTAAGNLIAFYNPNGNVGTIQTSASATTYSTSSDYRLKEDITPMTGALAKVALLKPCTYKWKVDGSDGQGFIAHEIQAVVEGCVSGEKDAVDDEGKPKYQGIDTSFLVATLTAAIQEQQALIIQLQADVAALKGVK